MKLTRQQRLGLLLTGILMALLALGFALTRPAPAVSTTQIELTDRSDKPDRSDRSDKPAVKKSKKKAVATPSSPSRNPLDEEF